METLCCTQKKVEHSLHEPVVFFGVPWATSRPMWAKKGRKGAGTSENGRTERGRGRQKVTSDRTVEKVDNVGDQAIEGRERRAVGRLAGNKRTEGDAWRKCRAYRPDRGSSDPVAGTDITRWKEEKRGTHSNGREILPIRPEVRIEEEGRTF